MNGKPSKARGIASLVVSVAALSVAMALALPALARDGHDGRFGDRDPAGTIASFNQDTGKLTIDLADGGDISGFVTRWAWIDDGDRDHCDDHGDDRRQLTDWCRRSLHGDDDRDGSPGRGDRDDLVPGAVVDDAMLGLTDGRAFFVKVELEG